MDTAYYACVNPPRKAKRPRIDNLPAIAPAPSSSSTTASVSRNDLVLGSDEDDDEEQQLDDDDDDDVVPPPKRRGRKPSTLSRAARESMRRQNHSRIEKARRTKINDALATLRRIVPAGEAEEVDDADYEARKKKGKQEKEFKLEVLERTVIYVQELQERVRELEGGTGSPDVRKRKRDEDLGGVISASGSEGRHSHSQSPVYPPRPSMPTSRQTSLSVSPLACSPRGTSTQVSPLLLPSSSSTSSPSRPRLPSISAWLPAESPSPALVPERARIATLQPQRPQAMLPTPPTSGTLGPTVDAPIPPALALDMPASVASPPWTPEDESAASLLLQIRGASPHLARVQTPGSILGVKLQKV